MTSILVTHEMAFAREIADHVYFTDHGVIVEDGPPAALFGAPQKERTRAFLEQVLSSETHAPRCAVVIGGGVVGASVLYHLREGRLDRRRADRARRAHVGLDLACGGRHAHAQRRSQRREAAGIHDQALRGDRGSVRASRAAFTSPAASISPDTPERMDFLKLACARARYLGLDMEIISVDEARTALSAAGQAAFRRRALQPARRPRRSGRRDAGVRQGRAQPRRRSLSLHARHRARRRAPTARGTSSPTRERSAPSTSSTPAGLWAREVGRMAGLDAARCWRWSTSTSITGEIPEVVASPKPRCCTCIDFEGEIYMRQEGRGMLIGTYEKAGVPWAERETPWNFTHELLRPDLDRIAPQPRSRLPALSGARARGHQARSINGPFTFAPDGNPLIGPIRGLRNYWVACGGDGRIQPGRRRRSRAVELDGRRRSGLRRLGDGRRALRRLGDARRTRNAKVRENYSRRFRIRFPNEELPRGAAAAHDADLRAAEGARRGVRRGVRARASRCGSRRREWSRAKTSPTAARTRTARRRRVSRGAAAPSACSRIATFARYEVTGAGARRLARSRCSPTGCRARADRAVADAERSTAS